MATKFCLLHQSRSAGLDKASGFDNRRPQAAAPADYLECQSDREGPTSRSFEYRATNWTHAAQQPPSTLHPSARTTGTQQRIHYASVPRRAVTQELAPSN